jgi:two-component system phosphate regulon sensor histidine kinase PhoR
MARESERLGRLVRDLLDLSRLEEATEIPSESVNLSRAASKALEQVNTQIESKEMDLVTDIEEEVWLHGDEEQLRMMIQNLLENAVRYTPKFGSIRFRVTREDEDAIVSVKDSGMGIPAESHSRVFERFYRVDRARSRDRGGTGLGLAIVKHVAELHGGGVNLSSEIGEGSTFSVHLPATEPAGETERVSQKTGG